MSPNSDSGPTELLRAWSQGDGSALTDRSRWNQEPTVSHGAICVRSGPITHCRRRRW
jgi:hypothetical protein